MFELRRKMRLMFAGLIIAITDGNQVRMVEQAGFRSMYIPGRCATLSCCAPLFHAAPRWSKSICQIPSALVLDWCWIGVALVLRWCCVGVALVLCWCCVALIFCLCCVEVLFVICWTVVCCQSKPQKHWSDLFFYLVQKRFYIFFVAQVATKTLLFPFFFMLCVCCVHVVSVLCWCCVGVVLVLR